MRLLGYTVLTALLTWAIGFLLPWWAIAGLTFLLGIFAASSGSLAFWGSAIGVFIAWFVQALWIDWYTNFILSPRIAELFHLPDPILLWLLTGLVGAIVGGLGGLSGYFLRSIFRRRSKSLTYR